MLPQRGSQADERVNPLEQAPGNISHSSSKRAKTRRLSPASRLYSYRDLGRKPQVYCDLFRRRITQGAPKRERYSGDLMNALTISAFTQSPKEFNFPSQNA